MPRRDQPPTGFRKKPLAIHLLAALYLALPLVTALQLAWQVDFTPALVRQLLLAPFFLQELGMALAAAIAIQTVSRIGFFCFLAISIYTLSVKARTLAAGTGPVAGLEFIAVSVWFGGTLLILLTALRLPYLNPELRWWQRPERFCYPLPAQLDKAGDRFAVVVMNLSPGGVFIKLDQRQEELPAPAAAPDRRRNLLPVIAQESTPETEKTPLARYPTRLGEIVSIRMTVLPECTDIFCSNLLIRQAEVVWTAAPHSPWQHGLGLRFIDQDKRGRKRLCRYLKHLKKRNLSCVS